jgi:hypothetical protein
MIFRVKLLNILYLSNSFRFIDLYRSYFTIVDIFLDSKLVLKPLEPAIQELRLFLPLVLR